MKIKYQPHLKDYSRSLRANMTDAERKLWKYVRNKQLNDLQFFRQKPVGKYIVDFYCPIRKLVIEIDGGQHLEAEAIKDDFVRDRYLVNLGFKVLRFNNLEVLKNIEGVIEKILMEIK